MLLFKVHDMENRRVFLFLFLSIICFNACNIEVKTDNKVRAVSNNKIRNEIKIEENGLRVEQAFLLKDDGTLINNDNKISVGERIGLRLIINGWKEKDSVVNIAASEKIATSDGRVLLDEKDLFDKDFPNGVKLSDAKILTLYSSVSKVDKLYDYYLVTFKIWDKTTNKSFSGSYKFYI